MANCIQIWCIRLGKYRPSIVWFVCVLRRVYVSLTWQESIALVVFRMFVRYIELNCCVGFVLFLSHVRSHHCEMMNTFPVRVFVDGQAMGKQTRLLCYTYYNFLTPIDNITFAAGVWYKVTRCLLLLLLLLLAYSRHCIIMIALNLP